MLFKACGLMYVWSKGGCERISKDFLEQELSMIKGDTLAPDMAGLGEVITWT